MDVQPEPASSSSSGISSAVGGRRRPCRPEDRARRRPLGLQDGDPEPLRHDLGRRRGELPAAARGPVGPRQERRDLVPRGEPLEDVRAERRRGRDCELHAEELTSGIRLRTQRAPAPRGATRRSVRSRMRTPSRWSSSCWTTRASMLVELEPQRLAVEVAPLERDRDRALDRHEHALEREAALVGDLGLVRALGDLGIDDRGRVLVASRLEDEEPLEDADLGRREPDAARVVHQVRHPLRQPRRSSSKPRPRARASAGRRPGTGGSARARPAAAPEPARRALARSSSARRLVLRAHLALSRHAASVVQRRVSVPQL